MRLRGHVAADYMGVWEVLREDETVTYGRYEVGGGGGHSGLGGGRGVPECFSEEGPHDGIAGEKQPATQQPQRDVKLQNTNMPIDLCALSCIN